MSETWKASQCEDGEWIVHTDGDIIATGVTEKNARLIAAAPDLLGNLVEAVEALEAFGVTGGGIPHMKAALAKATA